MEERKKEQKGGEERERRNWRRGCTDSYARGDSPPPRKHDVID